MEARQTSPETDAAVTAEQVRSLYQHQPISLAGAIIVAGVVGISLIEAVDRRVLYTWLITITTATAVRAVAWYKFHRRDPDNEQIDAWGKRAVVLSFVTGCIWAALPISFISGDAPFTMINIVVLSSGMLAGSLAAHSVHLPTLYAFCIPLMIGLSGSVHVNGGDFSHFAYLGYIFSVALLAFARGHNRLYRESIETRFENDQLIAELRRQKAEAEAANLAKSRFLAAASHDLRQPLHAVGLYAGALRDTASSDKQRELNGRMSRAIEALEQLLGHILEVSKLDAGVVEPLIKDFRAGELLERLDLRYGAIAKSREISYSSIGHDFYLHSDPVLLERILDNLIANAFRFTQTGTVALDIAAVGEQLHISVSDTGIGILQSEHETIFQEFFQIGNPERDRSKGLGLGLSIVQRLCTLLGHELDLVSVPGEGSRFTVVVAAGDASAASPAAADSSRIEPDLGDCRVLVIDDEKEVRDATREQLESWGCQVRTAGGLRQALEVARDEKLDLMIVDYRLRDGESGIDTVRNLRQRFGVDLPAVLITGDTAPDRIKEAMASGIKVLHKPVTPAKLRLCVSQQTLRGPRGGETSPARAAR